MGEELFRVNTRLPVSLNEKLEKEAAATGLTKTALIIMALNNYFQQKEAVMAMGDMKVVMEKLDKLQEAVQRKP